MGSLHRAIPYAVVASLVAVFSVWITASAAKPMVQPVKRIIHVNSADTAGYFNFRMPKAGPQMGDSGVFRGVLTAGAKKVGTDSGTCSVLGGGKLQCQIQVNLAHQGHIEMMGTLSVCAICGHMTGTNWMAIIGGTGQFSQARGWVVDTPYDKANKDHLALYIE